MILSFKKLVSKQLVATIHVESITGKSGSSFTHVQPACIRNLGIEVLFDLRYWREKASTSTINRDLAETTESKHALT
jgi:hypothetical protein